MILIFPKIKCSIEGWSLLTALQYTQAYQKGEDWSCPQIHSGPYSSKVLFIYDTVKSMCLCVDALGIHSSQLSKFRWESITCESLPRVGHARNDRITIILSRILLGSLSSSNSICSGEIFILFSVSKINWRVFVESWKIK